MTIYETIRRDLIIARKNKDSKLISILSTLLGEMSSKGVLQENGSKLISDNDAISILKKNLKSIQENLSLIKDDKVIFDLIIEKNVINIYLPKQLNEEDLRKEISSFIIANDAAVSMGDIMKYLKDHYNGLYDGKIASKLAKELLNV